MTIGTPANAYMKGGTDNAASTWISGNNRSDKAAARRKAPSYKRAQGAAESVEFLDQRIDFRRFGLDSTLDRGSYINRAVRMGYERKKDNGK